MKKSSFKELCSHLVDKKYKRILLMFIAILVLNSLINVTTGTNVIKNSVNQVFSTLNIYTEEKKNMTPLKSAGYDTEVGGSVKVEKSADWTGYKKARININLDTIGALPDGSSTPTAGIDAIFVVDTSGSMYGSKLTQVKQDVINLSNELLDNTNNKVALISFNDLAEIKSNFTNDKSAFTTSVNSLMSTGCTDYGKAYKEVGKLLETYTIDDNRDIIMVFLTDGFPTSSGHKTEYTYLKQKYPDMLINGIQYELGRSIIQDVIDMSDYQYLSNKSNLYETLFDIYGNLSNHKYQKYESFSIEDILSDEFEIESVEDIKVSTGNVELENKKIKWNFGENSFKSGSKATMEINVKFTGEVKKGFFPTNDSLKVTYKLPNTIEQMISTENTPVLQNGYEVTYEVNSPSDCHNILVAPSKEIHFYGEKVTKQTKELECDNYIFQGWELADATGTDIVKPNEDTFIMPSHEVTFRGVWSTLDIAKSMEGEVAQEKGDAPFNTDDAVLDNIASTYVTSSTGIDFTKAPSNTNGNGLYIRAGTEDDEHPIYYYRGKVTNNYVVYANYCWRIVRTTEKGGTKLIYYGTYQSGKCSSRSMAFESTYDSMFSPSHVGYMRGTNETYSDKEYKGQNLGEPASDVIFANDITYNNGIYTLKNTKAGFSPGYYYSCLSSNITCSEVAYIHGNNWGDGKHLYYIILSSGKNIEDAKKEMFSNKYDSTVKKRIDEWFETNINNKIYATFLEDAVWCNDRTITSGTMESKDGSDDYTRFRAWDKFYSSKNKLEPIPLVKDKEVCPNKTDRFTVSDTLVGNGDLKYPIALLTVDEAILAGTGSPNTYLSFIYPSSLFMTPAYYGLTDGSVFMINGQSGDSVPIGTAHTSSRGVFPSVVLNSDIVFRDGGEGTSTNPYHASSIHNIKIEGNRYITPSSKGYVGDNIHLEYNGPGNKLIQSFKVNGALITGSDFTMPDKDAIITEVTLIDGMIIESEHGNLPTALNNKVYGEKIFEGATSLTVTLEYQTYSTSYPVSIYNEPDSLPIKTYGGSTKKTETFTLNGNYIKISMSTYSYSSSSNYYGFKATIIPNYDGGNHITFDNENITTVTNLKKAKEGTNIKLKYLLDENKDVGSFKVNGKLIEGNHFVMPDEDVKITDVRIGDVIESEHYPYPNSLYNKIYGERKYDGATSLTVILEYQTYSTSYPVRLFNTPDSTTPIGTYGGTTRKTEVLNIEGDYIKINMSSSSSSSSNNYYGFKVIIIPHYGTFNITVENNAVVPDKNNQPYRTAITLNYNGEEEKVVTSFKMNGVLIQGNTFTMPEEEVVITDVTLVEMAIIESEHNPYPNSQNNVVMGEKTFAGAKTLTVTLDIQTESTSYDWVYLYDSPISTTPINNQKYGGTTRQTHTITINGDYVKVVFKTDGSGNSYYGFKATIVPNY